MAGATRSFVVPGPLVNISSEVEATIIAHARRLAPEESCGLLIGRASDIFDAVPVNNIAADPTRRYLIDPRQYLHAIRAARARGLEVIGAYHSHPRSQAQPSETDAEEGFGDFLYVIVGLATDQPEVTAWTWADGNFTPVSLVRVPEGRR